MLIFNNKVTYRFPTTKPNWEQDLNSQQKQKDRAQYANSTADDLDDSKIKEYLGKYAELLYNKLNFSQYPHFCIIVRPISAIEGEIVIPLGNLYLHFATMSEKNEDFYKQLITNFLVVWFKRKGVKIIQEIKQDTINEYFAECDKCPYLPIISHLNPSAKEKFTKKLSGSGKSIKDFYDSLYKDNSKKEDFETTLNKMCTDIIPLFNKLKNILIQFDNPETTYSKLSDYLLNKSTELPKFSYVINNLKLEGKFWSKQGQARLKKDNANLTCFINILLRREIFKIGFILFEIDKDIMVNLIQSGCIRTYPSSFESDYTALWTEIFIPWKKNYKNTKELHDFIKNSFSVNEKLYYERYESIKASL